jgi:hypothetical protein
MKKSELKQLIKEVYQELNEVNKYNYKVGDIVGNTVNGFNFKVLKIYNQTVELENINTGKKHKMYKDNVYLPTK